MQLGWVDFSREDREKVLDVLNLLQEQGAVDEITAYRFQCGYAFPDYARICIQHRQNYLMENWDQQFFVQHWGGARRAS